MATSSRRTLANKQNALQSTGPRTAAGKAASSANSVQHGILSRHLILPGERRDEFDALLEQLMGEEQPVGTLEQALVERMAVALWRQRRLVAAETAQLQLQQAELTYQDYLRVKQITGVDEMDWINALSREPLPDLVDLQADVVACDAWMNEDQAGDGAQDLATLPARMPRVWALLADTLDVDTTEAAGAKILGEHGEGLYDWVDSVRDQAVKLLKVVTALQQLRQSALQSRTADVLSRYQSSLDNDLYKAVRILREMQRHRLDEAALTAQPIEPMASGA
jgi:hypothetical protein